MALFSTGAVSLSDGRSRSPTTRALGRLENVTVTYCSHDGHLLCSATASVSRRCRPASTCATEKVVRAYATEERTSWWNLTPIHSRTQESGRRPMRFGRLAPPRNARQRASHGHHLPLDELSEPEDFRRLRSLKSFCWAHSLSEELLFVHETRARKQTRETEDNDTCRDLLS